MREDLLGWLTLLALITSSVAVTAAAVRSLRRPRADPYLPTSPVQEHRRAGRGCDVHPRTTRCGGGRW